MAKLKPVNAEGWEKISYYPMAGVLDPEGWKKKNPRVKDLEKRYQARLELKQGLVHLNYPAKGFFVLVGVNKLGELLIFPIKKFFHLLPEWNLGSLEAAITEDGTIFVVDRYGELQELALNDLERSDLEESFIPKPAADPNSISEILGRAMDEIQVLHGFHYSQLNDLGIRNLAFQQFTHAALWARTIVNLAEQHGWVVILKRESDYGQCCEIYTKPTEFYTESAETLAKFAFPQ
jgi:hypothetical protein